MATIERAELSCRPAFFSAYIDEAPEGDLLKVLQSTQNLEDHLHVDSLRRNAHSSYQKGKWTVNDVLLHAIDTERIFSYRALRIARGDRTALPGFDQDLFAANARANQRAFDDLLAEGNLVRKATITLYSHLDRESLISEGTCSGIVINAAALGFAIVGHHAHHIRILNSRYGSYG